MLEAFIAHMGVVTLRRDTWVPSITFSARVLLLRLQLSRLRAFCDHLGSLHHSLYHLLSMMLLSRKHSLGVPDLLSIPLIASLSSLRRRKMILVCPIPSKPVLRTSPACLWMMCMSVTIPPNLPKYRR